MKFKSIIHSIIVAIFCSACSNGGGGGSGGGSSASSSTDSALADSSNYLQVSLNNVSDRISLNEASSCAIQSSGKLYCWGLNQNGAIGLGNLSFVNTPRIVDSNENYVKVRVGKQFGCAITTLGKLKCFGDNTYGQAGNGSNLPQTTPAIIDDGTNYSDISVSSFIGCGITTSATLKCWGFNTYGAVGTVPYDNNLQEPKVAVPTLVPIGQSVRLVKTETTHSCAISTNNDLYCWGMNRYIGINQASGVSGTPIHVDAGYKYLDIAVGNSTTCGITTTHLLRCWGDGASNGSGSNLTLLPQTIDSANSYQKISMGSSTVCGITNSQIPKCWGLNDQGQVGVNSVATNITVPTPLSGLSSLSDVQAYNRHTCGLNLQGKIMCWGANHYGQVGVNSSTVLFRQPILAISNYSFVSLTVHQNHSCAIRSVDGSVFCWGSNLALQTGLGSGYEMAAVPLPLSL